MPKTCENLVQKNVQKITCETSSVTSSVLPVVCSYKPSNFEFSMLRGCLGEVGGMFGEMFRICLGGVCREFERLLDSFSIGFRG